MSTEGFAGTRRYTPTRVLGAGSWGRVYQAYDNERNAFVAVKLLQRASPDSLVRFKREFRSLQDLVHPNLVTLYELLSDKDQWFFTMELVDGLGFLDHVRGGTPGVGYASGSSSSSGAPTINERAGGPALQVSTATVEKPGLSFEDAAPKRLQGPAPPRHRASPEALARLRRALGPLIEGVCALHAAGKLHRDVKPSNVLVSREGRVVLLDFGLVHELSEPDDHNNRGMVVGTPAYMSPEQAGGLPLGEASDWYAVGVLIYEALTAQVPFEGPSTQMLKQRRTEDPPAPSTIADGVPADLDALCMRLLSRRPEQRPSGTELLGRFSSSSAPAPARAAVRTLVGRESELAALNAAFAWVKERRAPALVSIEAASGLGKSALIEHFLAHLRATEPQAVVLESACGERETVPFKAFDAAIDSIASVPALKEVLPRDFRSLTRLFPVLKRAEVSLPEGSNEVPVDPAEIRRRAFAALRELVTSLSHRAPVVLALDDLHFSDEDSAALLEGLLKAPNLPPVMLLAAFRHDPTPAPAVRALEEAAFASAGAHDVLLTRLELAPLSDEASRALVGDGLHGLVREGRGNPLLLERLASIAGSGAATLADWVQERLKALTPASRRLLEVIAIADRPVERLVAWHAAGLDAEQTDPLMGLKAARLVSAVGAHVRGERLVTDPREVGQAIRDGMPRPEQQRVLLALADALAASPKADFETVADWALEAGDVLRASLAAERAGDQARDVLAFERAARLYERAMAGRVATDVQRLQRNRAEAFAAAGRGKESAAAYLKLASTSDREVALQLRQRAAEQLLYSGHVDAGLVVMSEVMAALGEPMPRSDALARAWTVVARVRVELRGLKWSVKPKDQQSPQALARTDAYWAAAKGFSLVDPIRGTGFQFTHFRHALDCGDPYRVGRALALEAGFHALIGHTHQNACHKALQLLNEVLKNHPNDHVEGLAALMAGCAALSRGDLHDTQRHLTYAVALFQEKCPDMTWEISSTVQYLAYALRCLGEYAKVRSWLEEIREWAQSRGDVYALTNFRVRYGSVVRLMDDDPKGARHEVETGLAAFSRSGYFVQHMWGYFADCETLLYEGKIDELIAREKREWELLRASGMMRIQLSRVLVAYLRGQVLALDSKQPPAAIDKVARLLESEGLPWSIGLAALLRGASAVREGKLPQALEHLDRGVKLLEDCGACTHAMAARRAAGELRGSQAVRDEADAWFRVRGIARPERFAAAFFTLPVSSGERTAGA